MINQLSLYLLPVLILLICLLALVKKVNAYDAFIEGSKEGLSLFSSVFPSLLAVMLAISLLRESGLFALIAKTIQPLLPTIPTDVFALIFFRPISGSASLALLIDILRTLGPDSLAGKMASVIQGSTDTTLYVITLYFSSVGVKKIRNALGIGLFADLIGIGCGILLTLYFFK